MEEFENTLLIVHGSSRACVGNGSLDMHPVFTEILHSIEICGKWIAIRTPIVTTHIEAVNVRAHSQLQRLLYEAWHCGKPLDSGDVDPDEGFIEKISSQIPHRVSLEEGWELQTAGGENRDYCAHKNGVRILVDNDEVVWSERRASNLVSLVMPSIRPNLSPGFISIFGSSGAPSHADVRLYVAPSSETAPGLLGRVSGAFEQAGLRYAAKTLSDPNAYGRRDATVVYIDEEDTHQAIDLVGGAVDDAVGGVFGSTPPLCAEVRTGIGLAFEPRTQADVSFGEHRLGAVAAFLVECARGEKEPTSDRLKVHLEAAGIDANEPHRNIFSPCRLEKFRGI